jgi:hypothetical protein
VADFVVEVGAVVVVVVVVPDVDAGVVVVVVLVVPEDDDAVRDVAVAALLDPGCSCAISRPMRAVDAVAATTTDCVNRRTRTRAR